MRLGNPTLRDRVLVILPTYHSPMEWLDRSIGSVMAQTYGNIQCMIVKDGCRVNDNEECDRCKETTSFCKSIPDARFSYYSLPANYGAAGWGPRNFAISNSVNYLICYLDDDNWYEDDHIASLYEVLSHTESDMSYTGTRLWSSDMKIAGDRVHPHAPKQGYIDTSEIMHRRSLIDAYGGWRKVSKSNDWDIVSRWTNVRWSHTNKVTLNFYLREGCGVHRQ